MRKSMKLRTKAMLLAMPFVFAFLLFYIIPFFASFVYSVVNNTSAMKFVGLDNYKKVLNNSFFLQALANTMKFTLLSVPMLLLFSFVLACLLSAFASGKVIRFLRSIFFMPLLMPSAAIVMFWRIAFSDYSTFYSFLSGISEELSLIVPVYIFFIWKNAGLLAVIIMSAIIKIPDEIYDAAKTDGANSIKKHVYITLPLLMPVLFFTLILGIVQSFKIYKEVYLLYGSYPLESLYLMQHFINNKFQKLDYAELSASSILFAVSILLFILSLFGIRRVWRLKNESK